MTPTAYRDLLRIARRHSRRAEEAEDLLQDALLAAVAAGRRTESAADRAWMAGVIRNRAAHAARSAVRQRRRETQWHELWPDNAAAIAPQVSVDHVLQGLPPSLKSVAALALSGHSRREIAYLLGVADTALRQRLSAAKRHLRAKGVLLPEQTPGLNLNLSYGRIRDALLPKLLKEGGLFASHDPDGHLIVFRRSQSAPPRQQQGAMHEEDTP